LAEAEAEAEAAELAVEVGAVGLATNFVEAQEEVELAVAATAAEAAVAA